VTASPLMAFHRDLLISLAVRHRLPAVYPLRFFADGGGLISYGSDTIDQYRLAAGYVDRILRAKSPPICQCKRRRRAARWTRCAAAEKQH
jgi:putative ABC transport system substrate-binding protein